MTPKKKTPLEEKLEAAEPGKAVTFTEGELSALKEMALWWMRFKGAVALGGVFGAFLKWLVAFALVIAAIKAGFLDYIAKELGR